MSTEEKDNFILFPSITGGGVLVRRSQIVGARPNGQEGAIIYSAAGPALYSSLTTREIASFLTAQVVEQNYVTFNATLVEIGKRLASLTGLKNVRLVDAHSFCWTFASLLRQEAEGALTAQTGKPGVGRIVGGREKSIIAMRVSAEQTTKNSNGQIVQTNIKNKDLRVDPAEFDAFLTELMDIQEDRCALTGIAFHFHSPDADRNLLPSLDRIDSNGHYERGNLQVVCRFINFWKGPADNAEFARLLALVRGQDQ